MQRTRPVRHHLWPGQGQKLHCEQQAAQNGTGESLQDTEQQITNLTLLTKQIDTYRKLKPIYDRYKASKDKEKFLCGFENEIILFDASTREIKKAVLSKLPSAEKLKAELGGLATCRAALQAQLQNIQREEKNSILFSKIRIYC